VSAAERALYGLAWHLRHRDTAAREALLATLTPAERAECQAVLELPGVPETLAALPDGELRRRMLSLAGKSREVSVNRHEVTTILSGGRGAPTIVVREPGWQQQAAAEQEARQRAETKAFIDQLQHEAFIREHSPRPRLGPVEQVYADVAASKWLAECAEARDLPRKQAELEEWARKVELERVMNPGPPQPSAEEERRARDNAYSYGLHAWMAANR
jgi:hypothetical protein